MERIEMEEALAYFRRYPIYDRLFTAMRKKYASLGHMGGSFSLTGLTEGEKATLAGFVGMDLGKDAVVKVSFSALSRALTKSRFHAFTWEEILVQYFGEPLTVKKEEQLQKQKEQRLFWEECLSQCQTEDVKEWLSGILLEHKKGYRMLERQYAADRQEAGRLLQNIISALSQLPADQERKQLLPVFSATVTGNPHYFDDGTTACNLLLNYGVHRFGEAEAALSGIEQRDSILYRMGILRDELSNACMAYNVVGWKEDGSTHQGLQGFYREKQAFQLTLNILGSLHHMETAQADIHTVYIVENPAVFSYLLKEYPTHTFLCTMGRLKLAGYAAIDLFPQSMNFYYAGDFDPDGLQIAQGLKKRYGKRLRLWNYKREYYEQALSDRKIDCIGLKKLEKIDIPELQEIKECLLQFQRAAYQERMLDYYNI